MPTGKRASMREGPLAALFRKTAQDGEPGSEERDPAPAQQPESHERAEDTDTSASTQEMPDFEEPRIPLPHERLRHAFSADIPENLLERPAVPEPVAPEPVAPEPAHDVYARV